MNRTIDRNGLHSSAKGLAEDLPAEHEAPAKVLALPAEEVLFEAFECQ